MKRLLFPLILVVCALPFALHALQETPALRLEITGVNATELPTATITANVYDLLGQPVRGLTAENFSIFGELETYGSIVSVENISDDNLPFATVLVIDVSDSMSGAPIAQAQEAARAFVNSVADNDPVALISFGSFVNVIQDFTTDKSALLSAIDSLRLGGRTALYQGAFDGINLAANSPVPRRAMVLLSDGAEFGGRSSVTAEEVGEAALARGVPVYTIGLGFGADRSFLERLSERTNGRFYESPTPDQLVEIYSELAAVLRSQYVITLNADLPLDGTEYEFGLRVSSGESSAEAVSVLRAPIPVPIVQMSELPGTPIEAPVTVTATVRADDPITGVSFSIGDETTTVTEEPYTFTIDPINYPPGDYSLSVVAQDEDGDTDSAEAGFTVAALPSQVSITPNLATLGAIAEETAVTVTVTGQTAPSSIEYNMIGSAFPDGEFVPLEEGSTILINPAQLAAGDNLLTIQVTNEGGATSTTEFPFAVAALAPTLSIEGIENGQTFDEPFSFEVTAAGQTSNINLFAMIDDQVFEPESVERGDFSVSGTFTLDPMQFEPGEQALMISATDENEMATFDILTVNIAALPPVILVNGLAEGDVLAEVTQVSINFISQTPVIHVAVFVDETELAHLVSAPYSIVLDPLDYPPGEHTLRIAADNASSQHSTLDINFTIAEGPSLTATALAPTATDTASPTPDTNATGTEQAAQAALLTATAETREAQASETQVQLELAEANANATGTVVGMTATAEAAVSGTQMVQQTETAAALATDAALATSNAQATQAARASTTAAAEATRDTRLTATQEFQASATSDARATTQSAAQQQALQSTRDALATANVQARVEATSTAEARETRSADATATEAVNATATAAQAATSAARSNATATRLAQLLVTETAAAEATLTVVALQTQTAVAQVTLDAQAAIDAAETETRDAQLSQTSEANITQTAAASETQAFIGTATAQQQATIDTQIAAVGITLTPNESPTAESTRATEIAQAPETEEARPSPSAQPTLTLIEAENPPSEGDLAPVIVGGVMLLILLLALVLMFLARRRRARR